MPMNCATTSVFGTRYFALSICGTVPEFPARAMITGTRSGWLSRIL